MTFDDIFSAIATLKTIRLADIPQNVAEFLLAFGYITPSTELPGFAERTREVDALRARDIFVHWLEERDRHVELGNFHHGELPEYWSPVMVDDVADPPGRYHGAVIYLPNQITVEPRGPSPIGHDKKGSKTTLHVLHSTSPFVARLYCRGRIIGIMRSVVTSRSWARSRIG